MLKIQVQYFLNEQGYRYFLRWYDEVSAITSKQNGFIKMNCEYGENPVIYLYFENEEKLSTWVSTKTHDDIVSKIEIYFTKPEEVNFEKLEMIDECS